MHKTALAYINTGVRNLVALGKKHQVPGANPIGRNRVAPAIEFGHGARWCNLRAGLVDVTNQTTAVKARLRRVAPIAVGRAHQAYGINGDITGQFGREA